MRAADYLIDIGPGAGVHGGQVVAAGTPAEVMANPDSLTGQYLSGKKKIEVPAVRRPGNGKVSEGRRRGGEQPPPHRRGIPAGDLHCGHRRVRQRQVLSGERGAVQAPGRGADADEGPPRQVRPHRGHRAVGQGGEHRPEPHRADAPLQPGHLHRPVQRHPGPVRLHARRPRAGATDRGGSASTSGAAGARPAPATAC